MKTNTWKWLVYLVLPVTATAAMATLYFSDSLVAQRLVAPKLPPLSYHSWREFGLLENAQAALLLVSFVALLAGAKRATEKLQRAGFVFAAFAALFIFLEEIDYGTHWVRYAACETPIEWFRPIPASEWNPLVEEQADGAAFTVHNHHLTTEFKFVGDTALVLLFVVLPLVAPRLRNRYVRYLAPDRFSILTVAAMLAASEAIHHVGHAAKAAFRQALAAGLEPARELGSLVHNLSEFREFNVYYLYAVYFATLAFCRTLEPPDKE